MLSETELLAAVKGQIQNAIGGYSSETESAQADALDYYMGEPYGDEEEGSSEIVTRDVMESVERTLASLLRVFASGDKTVQFDPTGKEDEEQAEQETDYVNYVFSKENDGFMIYHDWFKNALLHKNSYVKIWVEEQEETETQTYEGLNDTDFAQVEGQENAEALEHTEYNDIDPLSGMPVAFHDIKIKVTTKDKRVRVAVVPNEEMGVAKNTNSLSLKDASFAYHRSIKTSSDLIQEGFDKTKVESIPAYKDGQNSELQLARENNSDEDETLYSEVDKSMREITVYECYIRMDYDEDGIAELRKVTIAGEVILDNEETDFIPFACISPRPMPHKHLGVSDAELVMPFQRIKSVLWRQMLMNLYLTNNPRSEVVDDKVNIDDYMDQVVGGAVRVKEMGSIREMTVPFSAGASLPMIELIDDQMEGLTGNGKTNSGLDPDVLAKTPVGSFLAGMDQSSQLTEKTARIFAETGVKDMFKMMHELILKHYDKEKVIKLRNKYVPVNPAEWKHRANMSVVVGLGTGNRDKELGQLFAMAEKQEMHLQNGSSIVTPKNVYNTYARLVERAELKDAATYWTDPDSPEAQQAAQQKAQQPQPNQLAEAEKVKGEFAIQKTQMETQFKGQLEQVKLQAEHEKQMMKMQLDDRARELDRQSKEAIEAMKGEVELWIAGIKADLGQPGISAGVQV